MAFDKSKREIVPLRGEIVTRTEEKTGRQIFIQTLNIFMPPLANKYHNRYTGRPRHLIFDTAMALIIFFLIGLNIYYFTRGELLPAPSLEIDFKSPDTLKSGEIVDLKLKLTNPGDSTIKDLAVDLAYPGGFVFQSASPAAGNKENNYWDIGSIAGRDSIEISLSGQIIAPSGEKQMVKALIQYRSGEETLNMTARREYLVSGSVLKASWQTPPEAESGDIYQNILTVENTGQIIIPESKVIISFPAEYTLVESNKLPEEKNSWIIKDFPAQGKWELSLDGKSLVNKDKEINFKAEVLIKFDNNWVAQASETAIIKIAKPPSVEDLIVPADNIVKELEFAAEAHYYGSSGAQFGYGPLPPKVGQTTGYRIFWVIRNNNQEYSNLVIKAVLPEAIDWGGNSTVSFGQNISYDKASRIISWTVGTLPANETTISASFELALKPNQTDIGKYVTLLGESTLSGSYNKENVTKTYPAVTTALAEALSQGKTLVIE
ncbi:MAG: hypothetical protein PHH01_03810 [Patescibacteria group bacterium]|nr:hypothetical protein [Patescibacteria group bacterium]